MKLFDADIFEKDEKIYVNLKGKIDTRTVNDFKNVLQSAKRMNKKEIILNYQDVEYVSSAGYGSLLQFCVYSKKEGINVYVTGMKKEIKNIFDIMELYRFVDYKEGIEIPEMAVEEKEEFQIPSDLEEWIEKKVIDNPMMGIEEYSDLYFKEKEIRVPDEVFKEICERKGLITKEGRLFFAYKKLREKIEGK